MAHVLNIDNLTLNPKEETTFENVKKFLAALTYMRPEIKQLHAIDTGVTMKQQIVIPSLLGKTGLKGSSTCDRQASGARATLSEKYMEPVIIEDTFVMCPKAELDPLFKAHYDKIQKFRDIYEFEGASDEQIFLGLLMSESINAAIWRAAWLGDTAVAAAGATTAGLLSAADIKFYNYFDGFLKQIIAGVGAGTIKRYEITENAQVTKEAQMTLASGRAIEIFEEVVTKADIRLKQDPKAQIYVSSDEMFENAKKYLRDKSLAFELTTTMEGLPLLKWDGKPVVNCESMFGLANKTDFAQTSAGDAYRLPHIVIFSTPENLRLHTLNENDFADIESWYNRDERKQKLAYGLTLDATVVQEHLVSVAY